MHSYIFVLRSLVYVMQKKKIAIPFFVFFESKIYCLGSHLHAELQYLGGIDLVCTQLGGRGVGQMRAHHTFQKGL